MTRCQPTKALGPYAYTETDPLSLHLDQTTPQTVSNGAPTFSQGIYANATGDTAITAYKDIVLRAGQKLIFDGAAP